MPLELSLLLIAAVMLNVLLFCGGGSFLGSAEPDEEVDDATAPISGKDLRGALAAPEDAA